MAVKRYCDVCGKEIKWVFKDVHLQENGYTQFFDVCEDCFYKVKRLLTRTNKEQANEG